MFVLLSSWILVSCSGSAKSGGSGDVEMTASQSFSPESVTISVGESVTWSNSSTEQHTVTAEEDSLPGGATYFSSGGASTEEAANDELGDALIAPGGTFTHTFDEPGTYRYYCIPHRDAGMTGTVVVTAD
jgi:plastocyanin